MKEHSNERVVKVVGIDLAKRSFHVGSISIWPSGAFTLAKYGFQTVEDASSQRRSGATLDGL
jgi:hypothetical protein